jgi:hypothetical protein
MTAPSGLETDADKLHVSVVAYLSSLRLAQLDGQLCMGDECVSQPHEGVDDKDAHVDAGGLFNTLAAMMAQCSVKTKGRCLMLWPRFKITVCDLDRINVSACSNHLLRGVAKAALYCAHRTSTFSYQSITFPSSLVFPL